MPNFKISIIIPTYNRAEIIKVAIDSILSQTYDNWECLVVDDGSNDETFNTLLVYTDQDDRIQFFKRSREPKGAPTCRNIGLEYATGDYVIYLDSDDYLMPFCLERRIEAIKSNSGCDFLVFPMGKKQENQIVKVEIPEYENYLIPFLSANLPWQTMCPIWKKSFLIIIGGFTEGYPRFNDPELMIRALLQPQIKFKVFNETSYDSVFLSTIYQSKEFVDKVYKSLVLFIPNIVTSLENQGKSLYRPYLSMYLHLWFKYIFVASYDRAFFKSFRLISLFKQEKIISSKGALSLILRLLLFWISNLFLSQPINKLTEKTIYK